MNEFAKKAKKALTATLVAVTAAWSIGASVLLAPLTARAAVTPGSLVKASLPAVYYVGTDNKRYVFPNEKTYKTWYADFSTVQTVSDAELAALQIGGNVTYRPGVRMVKIQSDPKVYAVDAHGVLRWVTTESIAIALYGVNWNTMIDDVSDAFFTNYTIGADITSASQFNPAAVTAAATSINVDKGLVGTPGGNLSVSLNSGTPASTTIAGGATRVTYLKFDVRNNGASATSVDTVVIHRIGAGESDDFSNVYLFEGDARLTTGRTLNTTTNEATFASLGLALAAGQSRTLTVAADMASSDIAGNVNGFEVTKVMSGTTQASGLPVVGNTITMSTATVGSLTIEKTGSLTNPKVGELNAKLADFRITAGSAEDIEIKSLILFNGGNINAAHVSNLKLMQAGNTIATASGIDAEDHITFTVVAPMLLERGNSRTFEVYGDIGAGARTDDTLNLFLEEDADALAIGRTLGSGVTVTNTSYDGDDSSCTSDATCSDSSFTTIEGGQVTITFNGPSGTDVATDANDVELFNFTIATQSNIEIRNWDFVLDGLDSADAAENYDTFVTDFKLVEAATGAAVTNTTDPDDTDGGAGDGTEDITFTDTYTMQAGTSKTFKITADMGSSIPTDLDALRVTLDTFDSSDIRNLDNNTFISTTDIVPSSDIAGNQMTLEAADLDVTASSSPLDQTYIQGSQNVEIGGFNFKAGDGADIRVTSVTVRGLIDSTDGGASYSQGFDDDADTDKSFSDLILSAKLMNGSTQLGDTESPTSSATEGSGGLMQFTNLNLLVPKGQTVTLKVVASIAASITGIADGPFVKVRVDADTDVSAQDPDGNTVTPAESDVDGNDMAITSAGTITTALAGDDVETENGLVVGGSSNVVLARYRFTAANEDLRLVKQRITLDSSAAAAAVTSLSLFDGATLVAGPATVGTLSGGQFGADFSSISNFSIPKDGSKTLTIKGNLGTVGGSSGAVTGTDVGVNLETDTNFEVRSTSAGSSTVITDGGTDINGRTKILRKSKPTVSNVSLPTSLLTAGEVVASRFTITADAAEQISIKKLTFTIAKTTNPGIAVTSESSVREVGNTNITGDAQVDGDTGTACAAAEAAGNCGIEVSFDSEQIIPAGTSKSYELRVTVSGTLADGDSLSTVLATDTAADTGFLSVGVGAAPELGIDATDDDTQDFTDYNFIWSDFSAVPHADCDSGAVCDDDGVTGTFEFTSSGDYTNGRFVKILPNDTQTVSR